MAGIADGGLCVEGRLTKAEATIQRVRKVAENEDYGRIFAEYGPDAELISVVPLAALNAALDGGDDE